jgi:2-keto-4-pentenoate hydratase/2-oxohepta-3-ene-1,7-dioic acid hydratase in catechol pathway
MGKSFDTFAPIGPAITTLDEVEDPNKIHVQFWNNGDLRHDYNTDDMEHRVPELVEFASGIMTLNSGDVLACGTNHEGLGPLQARYATSRSRRLAACDSTSQTRSSAPGSAASTWAKTQPTWRRAGSGASCSPR